MYRDRLPQLEGGLFITDGGLETTLIYHQGLELPAFAAFDLLKDDEGTEELRRYYAPTRSSPASRASASCSRARPGAPTRTGPKEIGYSLDELDALQPQGDRADGGAPRRSTPAARRS